jgi:DNA modification methylase
MVKKPKPIPIKEMIEVYFKIDNYRNKRSPKKIHKFFVNRVNHANSLYALMEIPDNSINVFIADPPFAIDFGEQKVPNYNRDSSNVLSGYIEVNVKDYYEFSFKWIKEAKRTLKKYGSIVIVSGWSNQIDILNAIRKNNLYLINQLIWKHNFGPFCKKKLVSSHYNIFFCTLHPKRFTFNKLWWYMEDFITNDVEDWNVKELEIPKEYWTAKKKTPNKLPKELVEMLIAMFSNNNDLIIDPFSGSGTILKCCSYMLRNCIAFDIVKEYCDFGNYRLKNLNY